MYLIEYIYLGERTSKFVTTDENFAIDYTEKFNKVIKNFKDWRNHYFNEKDDDEYYYLRYMGHCFYSKIEVRQLYKLWNK